MAIAPELVTLVLVIFLIRNYCILSLINGGKIIFKMLYTNF